MNSDTQNIEKNADTDIVRLMMTDVSHCHSALLLKWFNQYMPGVQKWPVIDHNIFLRNARFGKYLTGICYYDHKLQFSFKY